MKFIILASLLMTMVACSKSKELVQIEKTCVDMKKVMAHSMKVDFDEKRTQTQCECTAKIAAPKCGTNCESPEGVGMFFIALTGDTAKEMQEKCPY